MSHIYRYILCLLLVIAGVTNVKAQQYPVTASTQIIPPYSVYLPDYAVPGSDKLRVILVQNDLTLPSYNIRLRMTVEQNGTVIMRTAATFNPKPLSLSPGIPTIIGGMDLTDYLNPANIEYSGGFSRTEYEKTRSLPEGAYRISFTAYDYARPQVQVSNMGSNVFFFRKSDPPLLNLPICNSRVEKLDPQFLTFNWSSRNSPNPIPGSGTEYVFSLYEIRPAGSNPDYIVRSAKPIYTLVTETNTIVYGPGEPALRDSMQYVWVVQARDKSGRDMFSNQGLSQSCTFTYLGNNPFTQRNIPKPVLKGRATGERSARFGWPLADASYQVEAYRLQYRAAKVGDTEFDWQTEEKQSDTAFTANSLEPNRVYEGRLQWKIAGVYGPYSDVVTVKTDSAKTFVCGDAALLAGPDNKEPIASLSAGKIIRVGNFDIILTEVSGGNGKFTGKGRVITLGFGIGLQMEFKDISVNTDLRVTSGVVNAVTEGIDKYVSDKLNEQHGGNDVGGVKTGDIVPDIVTKLKIFTPANIKVNTDEGTITLKDSETGKEEVINYKDKGKTLPLVLEDAGGNLYNIDKGGKVTAIGKRDSTFTPQVLESLKNVNTDKGAVNFTPGAGNIYGFDTWQSTYAGKTQVEREYESLANGKYHVSAKVTVPAEQEEVIATLTNAASGITASKLKFVTGKGIVLEAKDNGNNTFSIKLTGGPGGDAQEIYATHPDGNGGYISMGKLLVVSYKPLQKKLVLVPIGAGTTAPVEKIKTALQQTYGKVGITYTVEVDENFRNNKTWDSNGDSVLQDKKSAFLSNDFTGEEKALKKAYKKSIKVDDNTVYLFVVNEAALADGDLAGKMPRASQFGFVFTKGATEATIVRTVVHEIGHGDYTLEHTFAPAIGLDKGSSDNLMDYGSGYGLLKFQWDILHDPGSVWGLFDDDAASQNYIGVSINKDFINKDGKTVSFLTPSGVVLALPFDRLGKVEFQYGAVYKPGTNDLKFGPDLTVGALRSFELANSEKKMEKYFCYDADGLYRNTVTNEDFKQDADPAMVDGFVFPIQCEGKLILHKFTRGEMQLYKGGETALKFVEFADRFRPFGANAVIKDAAKKPITQDISILVSDKCLHCVAKSTISMIKGHCDQPEYLWIDKIAQMRHVYPQYFERFTQPEVVVGESVQGKDEKPGDWEQPKTVELRIPQIRITSEVTIHDYDYIWGKYLIEHPDIRAAYSDKNNKVLFYKTFYTEFVKYISDKVVADDKFWETLSESTDVELVFDQVEQEPMFHLQAVPVEKRGLALKRMTDDYRKNFFRYKKDSIYMRLLSSFKLQEQAALLEYIERKITIIKIYELFDVWHEAEETQIAVMMALSNMVTATGRGDSKLAEKINEMKTHKIDAQVEADLLQFKNATVIFLAGNDLTINGKLYKYSDIVSIQMAGLVKIGDSTYKSGTILQIPAIQVALMRSITGSQVTAKTAWLVFDIGTMALGIGGAKVLLTAGNYIRKAIVVADLVGSTAGIGLQLLNDDAISPELRTSLQIACFVVSLPNMAMALPQIDNVVHELDAVLDEKRAARKLASGYGAEKLDEEIKALDNVRTTLSTSSRLSEMGEDAKQIGRRVVALDGDKIDEVTDWLKAAEDALDNNVYIVVHGDKTGFSVIHNGVDTHMDYESLANFINGADDIPKNGQLVLLSCVDIETAQNLSKTLGRSVIANDGAVRVYRNGVIEADNGFKYIDEGGNIDDSRKVVVGKQQPADGEMVQLGKAVTRDWNVATLTEAFGINSSLARKLIENTDFITACRNNDRIIQVIKNELPLGVNGFIGSRRFTNYREAILTAFTEDATLFAKLNKQIKESEAIVRSGKLTTEKYKQLNAIRVQVEEILKEAKFETSFFANSVFTTAIYRHPPLDDAAMQAIDAARAKYGIAKKQNILLTEMEMADGKKVEQVAHSGKDPRPTNLPDPKLKSEEIIPDAVRKDINYDQFSTGAINRLQDSESKYLEYIWRKIVNNELSPNDIKRIKLFSERPVCPSCANAIRIFREKFPNIEVIVYEGKYLR